MRVPIPTTVLEPHHVSIYRGLIITLVILRAENDSLYETAEDLSFDLEEHLDYMDEYWLRMSQKQRDDCEIISSNDFVLVDVNG